MRLTVGFNEISTVHSSDVRGIQSKLINCPNMERDEERLEQGERKGGQRRINGG